MKNKNETPERPGSLFVYGTLRTGEPRHKMLEPGRVISIIAATVPGKLLNFREYPGLVAAEDDSALVRGELVQFGSFHLIAKTLDEYEGADFQREVAECTLENGSKRLAWMYRFVGSAGGVPVIVSGDWLRR